MFRAISPVRLIYIKMSGHIVTTVLVSAWRTLWRQKTALFSCCLLMTVISLLYTLHTYSGFSLIPAVPHRSRSLPAPYRAVPPRPYTTTINNDNNNEDKNTSNNNIDQKNIDRNNNINNNNSPPTKVPQMTASVDSWLLDRSCSAHSNIAFLKSHKCASSAIQNILFRYGYNHGLHMAIPDYGNYYGTGANLFMAAMVRSTPWSKLGINIFAIHTKWNYPEMLKLMPNDTIYLTIVREPIQLFESLYAYTKMDKYYNLTVEEFAMTQPATIPRFRGFLGYNQMASDLGMAPADIHNITKVANRLEGASEEFDLVLVAERMDESLVLLAHRLCWDLEDVMVLKLNARRNEYKSKLSEEVQAALRDKLDPDYLIYRHFLSRFDALVQDFGQERMERELTRLRNLTKELHIKCEFEEKPSINMNGFNKPWSPLVDGYSTSSTNTTCSLYSINEHSFIQRIRDKQRKEYIKRTNGRRPM